MRRPPRGGGNCEQRGRPARDPAQQDRGTPIIVHAVGATDYGIWVLVGAVATFGGILELGISAGLVKYVAEHAAREEVDEAARIVGAATWLYQAARRVLRAGRPRALLLAPLVLGLEGDSAELARALGALAALDLGISMLSLAPLSVLKGLQRFPTVNVIQAGAAIFALAFTAVAVLGAGGEIVTGSAPSGWPPPLSAPARS